MKRVKWSTVILFFTMLLNTIAMEGKFENCKHCKTPMHPSTHGNAGFWLRDTLPHKNWKCIKTEEAYPKPEQCTMCEKPGIKFLHCMRHKDVHFSISVDYICAGMMEGNPEAAKVRDERLKQRSAERLKWPILPGWKMETKSTRALLIGPKTEHKETTIKTRTGYNEDTHVIVIKQVRDKFQVFLDGEEHILLHDTLLEAQLMAFDLLWPLEIK